MIKKMVMKKKSRKGQVAIFVILGILIAGVLLVVFLPDIGTIFAEPIPDVELSSCLESNVREAMELTFMRGGSIDPELYYMYNGEPLEYLCYTRDYYSTCVMQKPLLKQSIETEIEAYALPGITNCINDLKVRLRNKGWQIESVGGDKIEVQFIPDNVKVSTNLELKMEKEDSKQAYEKFETTFNSKSYDMIMIASSISNWEATYGDAAPELYMGFYHDLKIEKKKQSEGTTLYILENLNSEEVLQFASRSLAWPPGYAA